jgi:ribosome modulation factor
MGANQSRIHQRNVASDKDRRTMTHFGRGYTDGKAGVPFSRSPAGWTVDMVREWQQGWRMAMKERTQEYKERFQNG